ncbi:hypothetical protein [Microbacterium sp. G2-8]|uniref:hypothetical protein n=1 Tax=Microbacterium sp. G2-8 TaxID=2842454 RepID=UPI001C89C29F|nr:hypothetical protein [Microbacterium sp. G2-8]
MDALVSDDAAHAEAPRVIEAIENGPEVQKLLRLTVTTLEGGRLLVAGEAAVPLDKPLSSIARDIDVVEGRLRQAVPSVAEMFLTARVYLDPDTAEPPTEAFVVRSSD